MKFIFDQSFRMFFKVILGLLNRRLGKVANLLTQQLGVMT